MNTKQQIESYKNGTEEFWHISNPTIIFQCLLAKEDGLLGVEAQFRMDKMSMRISKRPRRFYDALPIEVKMLISSRIIEARNRLLEGF